MQTAPVSLDSGVDRRAATCGPRASRTTHVSDLSQPRSEPRARAHPLPTLGKDAKGCSCHLISARGGLSGDDPSRGGADAASVESETHGARPRRRREAPVPRASSDSDVDESDMPEPEEEDDVGGAHLRSSEESLSPDSLAPSSLSTIRSRLFASDDEEDADDLDEEDEVGSALSSWSGWSPSSCFLPSASASSAASPPPPPPPRRASLSSTAATSDPLRHSLFSSPPKLEFDRVRQRAHWLPAPSHPTAETAWSAPDVPDVVRSSLAASSSPCTPPNSPPRAAASSASPTRPESLLTKSLRSLSRLPNLTLADVLPRAASTSDKISTSVDDDEDLAALPPGWGPAERRRVLAEEPSHAADEARAGFRYLLRRPPSPFTLVGRSRSPPSSSSSSDFGGYPIDEVEALGYGFGFGLKDLGASSSSSSEREPPSSCPAAAAASPSVEDKVDVCVEAPTSPSADVPPLPPRPHEKSQVLVQHAASTPIAALAPPSSLDQEVASSPSAPPSPPPQPQPQALPPRFVSNHRHLLMLALEFEMMRHAKIRGPLRQRAVIVRQATSPPRERGAARERSRLCHEVSGEA